MNPTALVVALSLATIPLALLASPADAFGWCTFAEVPDHQCHSYYACVGWGWSYQHGYYTERCQYGVGPWDCLYEGPCMPYLP